MTRPISTLPALAVVACTVAISPSYAADESAATAAALDEVVVTARKREESVQDVPIAMSVLGGDALSSQGITDIRTFATQVPGLVFSNHADLKTSETSIRGVRSESRSAGQDPSVGYYLDEVYLGGGVGAAIDYFDLQRIEVLRGPQGALFGRNTIGGVISLSTRRPTFAPEGYVEVGAGNYGSVEARAAVSGPLVDDRVAGRLAVSITDRDGYAKNLSTGRDVEDAGRKAARGSLLFNAGESTELLASFDYLRIKQRSNALETFAYSSGAGNLLARFIGGFPGPNRDPYDRRVVGDLDPVEDMKAYGANLRATVDLGSMTLVSISGYREHEYYGIYDTEQTDARWTYSSSPESVRRFSQEIRLASAPGEKLDWLAGLYYYRQHTINEFIGSFGVDALGVLRLPAGFFVNSVGDQETKSYAAFANATYRFSPSLSATLGVRYTRDQKDISYDQRDPIGVIGGSRTFTSEKSFNRATPSLSLSFTPNESLLIYGLVANGFKSGGFNDFIGDATAVGFEPEKLWNYEVGAKAELLDRRLTMNASAFVMRWSDIQLQADNPATPFFDPATRNAGAAESRGLELEVRFRPVERLSLSVAAASVDAKFTEGFLPDGRTPLRQIPYSPQYTANLGAEYRQPLPGSTLDFEFRIEGQLTGVDYLDTSNIPQSRVDAWQELNAWLTLAEREDRWSVSLWGRNLTDDTRPTRFFNVATNPLVGQQLIALNAPRTFGIRARVQF